MITTRSNLQTAETLSEAVADRFFEDRSTPQPALGGAVEFFWRYMQAGTIASGTTEMLQRQLARAMFGGERIRVTEEVADIRTTVDRLATACGGVDLARQSIGNPALRREARDGLHAIIADLDPREGRLEGLAAAEVCRAAGRAVLPLPVESMLMRRPDGHPLVLTSPHGRFEHGDLFDLWHAASLHGDVQAVVGTGPRLGSKVGPFVNLAPPEHRGSAPALSQLEHALLHILPSWYLLGSAEQALHLATVYATERVQFGAPISSYQGVAFPLADACAELQALYELALDTMHRIHLATSALLVDALALRWATLDIVRRVLRISHQVLGAVGMCEEHDLTIITLTLQARLRLPTDLEASMAALVNAVDERGFDSIFTPVSPGVTRAV